MRSILLVDDSALIQALYKQILGRRADLSLASASNGQHALDLVASRGEPHLILLDVNMPRVDGLSFLEQSAVFGLPARVPIIIVSTEGTDRDVAAALARGARAYLRKPFRAPELNEVVDRMLAAPKVASVPAPGRFPTA